MKKFNYFIGLKRYVILLLIILFSAFCRQNIYAERLDLFEIGFYGWYVTMEDIYALREKYEENPDLEKDKARDFLIQRAENYKKDMDYINTGYGYGNVLTYSEDIGYQNYYISNFVITSSYLGPGPIYLYSGVSGNYIALDVSEKELDEFVEYNDRLTEEYRTVYEYAHNYLQDSEYMGVSVKDGVPCIWLSDEGKAKVLEKEGIAWEFSEKSREDIYQQLQYLWENREELQIVEVLVDYGISIYGLKNEKEFKEEVKGGILEDCYYEKAFKKGGIDKKLTKIEDWHELAELSNFILMKRNHDRYIDWGENFWKELEPWLEYMKQLYPGYSYENLFHLAYISRDKNYYTDFDNELKEFAEGLGYIENQKNPFDEDEFGDPEHLVLQVLLEKYKQLYPEEEYVQLYDTYVREINENILYTAEEKRNRLIWKLLQAEEELKKLKKPENDNRLQAEIGFGLLIISCGIFAVIKKKKETINEKLQNL